MYVAMTRAEQNLYITAEEDKASTFFTKLDIEKIKGNEKIEEADRKDEEKEIFTV